MVAGQPDRKDSVTELTVTGLVMLRRWMGAAHLYVTLAAPLVQSLVVAFWSTTNSMEDAGAGHKGGWRTEWGLMIHGSARQNA